MAKCEFLLGAVGMTWRIRVAVTPSVRECNAFLLIERHPGIRATCNPGTAGTAIKE